MKTALFSIALFAMMAAMTNDCHAETCLEVVKKFTREYESVGANVPGHAISECASRAALGNASGMVCLGLERRRMDELYKQFADQIFNSYNSKFAHCDGSPVATPSPTPTPRKCAPFAMPMPGSGCTVQSDSFGCKVLICPELPRPSKKQ